uniref:Uncharacterized protein n=1 Tax=Sphaerodactylus townsendi TaxID=933632 RepID=A0ACB8EFI6_9SAUR
MRRFVLSTLRDYGMGKKTIEDRIIEECGFLIKRFESYEGKPFENTDIMNGAVANITVSILLGKRFGYEDSTFIRLQNLVTENVRLFTSPSAQLYNMFPALGFLLGAHKTLLNNRDELHAFIQATFIEYLKDLDENDQRSFIDSFLILQQEVTPSFKRITSFRVHFCPIKDKVQEEIARVVGSAQPRTEHRPQMPYTDAVIHEIQRFSNIVPISVPRATTVDVTLKGYSIPKGTFILPLLCSVLQDETQWERPQQFYPEHFLDSDGKFVKRDAFMPFSAGRRMCAGETLAKMELFLFFTSLLQRFTFLPAPGMSKEDLDLTPMVGMMTPPIPYKCCALSRS